MEGIYKIAALNQIFAATGNVSTGSHKILSYNIDQRPCPVQLDVEKIIYSLQKQDMQDGCKNSHLLYTTLLNTLKPINQQ